MTSKYLKEISGYLVLSLCLWIYAFAVETAFTWWTIPLAFSVAILCGIVGDGLRRLIQKLATKRWFKR